MQNLKTLSHKLRSTEAAEIAEAALVLPVVFLFLIGIIWFGPRLQYLLNHPTGRPAGRHHCCKTHLRHLPQLKYVPNQRHR